jgi:hypothetical protein
MIPAALIPERAWGISGQALTQEEIAASDPFAGLGVRLEIPPGTEVTIEDIQQATECEHVVLFPDCAWVERYFNCGDVVMRWNAWLARPGRGEPSLGGPDAGGDA